MFSASGDAATCLSAGRIVIEKDCIANVIYFLNSQCFEAGALSASNTKFAVTSGTWNMHTKRVLPLSTAAVYKLTKQVGTDDEVKVKALSVYSQDPIYHQSRQARC